MSILILAALGLKKTAGLRGLRPPLQILGRTRWAAEPVIVSLLESLGDANDAGLVSKPAYELQADWKIRRGEAARNRNGRNCGEVRRAIEAKQKSPCRVILLADTGFLFPDWRCGNRRCWNGYRIYTRTGDGQVELLNEFVPQIESFEVSRSGDFCPHFQARTNVLTVL